MTGATRAVARVAPAAVLLTLALIRAIRIPLSRDEMATQMFAALPVDALLRAVQHVDTVVAPFYLLETLVVGLPGDGLGLRIPSIVASVAAVFVVSAIARRWWGEAPALVAGLAFATNPLVLQMATTARPYACAMLAVALATLAASAALEATGRQALLRWIGFSVCVLAIGLLHLFALLAVPPLVLLTAGRGRRAVASFAVAFGAAVVALLPFAIASMAQRGQVAWIAMPDPVRAVGALANLVRSPERIGLDVADLVACLLVVGLAVAAIVVLIRAARSGDYLRLSSRASLRPNSHPSLRRNSHPNSRTARLEDGAARRDLARLGAALGISLLPWATLLVMSLTVVPVLRTAYLAPSVVGVALLVAGSAHALATAGTVRGVGAAASTVLRAPSARARPAAVAASVTGIIALALTSAASGAAARFWQDDFPSLAGAMASQLAPGDVLVVVQHHHETGLAGGMARAVGDTGYVAETSGRLPLGTQPGVEVRRVTSVGPFRSEACRMPRPTPSPLRAPSPQPTPSPLPVPTPRASTWPLRSPVPPGTPDSRVFVVSTTFPLTGDDERMLRERGLGCVVERAPIAAQRFGGLVLRAADCG